MFIQTYINTIMNNGIIAIIIHFDLSEATCQEYFKNLSFPQGTYEARGTT